jgi:hypothetical protein
MLAPSASFQNILCWVAYCIKTEADVKIMTKDDGPVPKTMSPVIKKSAKLGLEFIAVGVVSIFNCPEKTPVRGR